MFITEVFSPADVSAPTKVEQRYLDLCEITFKGQYRNHVHDFKHQKYETSKEFSDHIWKKKRLSFITYCQMEAIK